MKMTNILWKFSNGSEVYYTTSTKQEVLSFLHSSDIDYQFDSDYDLKQQVYMDFGIIITDI